MRKDLTLKRRKAALTRVIRTGPAEMTRAMNQSKRHPGNIRRWIDDVLAENPALTEAEARPLAQQLMNIYFREISAKGVAARAAKAAA